MKSTFPNEVNLKKIILTSWPSSNFKIHSISKLSEEEQLLEKQLIGWEIIFTLEQVFLVKPFYTDIEN